MADSPIWRCAPSLFLLFLAVEMKKIGGIVLDVHWLCCGGPWTVVVLCRAWKESSMFLSCTEAVPYKKVKQEEQSLAKLASWSAVSVVCKAPF